MNLSNLTADVESIEETLNLVKGQKKEFKKDERQFRPNLKNDKKEYHATIRFLPQGVEGIKGTNGKTYYVERWDHAFMENGMWYIEKCPSLINKINNTRDEYHCPVCEANRDDYNSKQEVLINRAKSRRVKKTYPTNILIIEDLQFPENNGKIMYWNMPLEIVKLIEARWKPETKRKPSNPYCPINGYPFELVLKINPKTTYPTYSGSDFLDKEQLAPTEKEIIEILNKTYDLSEFGGTPAGLKPYNELKKRFAQVTSGGIIAESSTQTVIVDDDNSPLSATSSISLSSGVSSHLIADEIPSTPIITDEKEENEDWID